jgi:hypothetical protein
MKENFEKAGGKDVNSLFLDGVYLEEHSIFASALTARAFAWFSLYNTSSSSLRRRWSLIKSQDTRIFKFKVKVEAKLEAGTMGTPY